MVSFSSDSIEETLNVTSQNKTNKSIPLFNSIHGVKSATNPNVPSQQLTSIIYNIFLCQETVSISPSRQHMPYYTELKTQDTTPYECPKFSLVLKHNNTIAQLLFSPYGLIIVRFLITVPLKHLSCVLSSVYTVTSNKFRRVRLVRY